jgi:peptide subunit release factor 1 (eRF1)
MDVTQDAIQVLIDHPKGQGMVVSCYADTSMAGGFQWLWSQHLRNEAQAIEQRLKDDPQARARFLRDVEIIRHTLDEPAVQQTRGMAVFSACDDGLFRAFSLGVPVKDRLVIDEAPYVVPLLEAVHRQRRYLVVVTDSQHGQLWEAAWGHTMLLQEIEEPVPRRQRSAGERWGKQQATIERHREDHVLHYLKDLARAIEEAWAAAPFRGLIALGEHETVQALRDMLSPPVAERIVHTGPYSWKRPAESLEATVQGVLDATLKSHDRELIEELERRLHEHYMIATGAREVVEALWNGQVGYPGFLVLEPDRGEKAARCTRCGSVYPALYSTCPACQGVCETVNLWQEILLFAARHNITAHTVASHPVLSRHGGVAAALSRPHSWEPAPEATKAADRL